MDVHSRLDYIMKSVKTSGNEVSLALRIDKTTISKWRNNTRKISAKHACALASFFLSSSKDNRERILEALSPRHEEILNYEPGKQTELLASWLTEEYDRDFAQGLPASGDLYTPKNGYNTNITVYTGEAGTDEALEYFFSSMLKMQPGKTLYLVDYSGVKWINGDESTDRQVRINTVTGWFKKIMKYGHKLVIIDCDTDIHRPYRAIFRWMELYLMEGVEVWTHSPLFDETHKYTTFVIENQIAAQFMLDKESQASPFSMLYKNSDTVKYYMDSVRVIMKEAKMLIYSLPSDHLLDAVKIVEKKLKPYKHIYMLNPSLTLHYADEELLTMILEANDISSSKAKESLEAMKSIARMKRIYKFNTIYDYDHIELFSKQEYILDRELSKISGSPVYLSNEQWRKLIAAVNDSRAIKDGSLIFTSFVNIGTVPGNLSIIAQDDSFAMIWDVKKYEKRLYSDNIDIVSGFSRYLDDIWRMIPRSGKDPEWQSNLLKKVLL